MGIVTNGDGFTFHDGLSSDWIVIEENRIDEYLDYINSWKLTKLSLINHCYRQKEIGFLAGCPHVEKVSIVSSGITDFSGLYNLKHLKTLYLDEPDGEIDLSQFTELEELGMGWTKYVKGLNKCTSLKNLSLRKYKPKSRNLEELFDLRRIRELVLTQTPITSLKGCRHFRELEKLELNYMRTFEMIDELEHNAGTLKHLRFDVCRKIKNHDYVACLKELELLAFDDCGDIPSIGFLRELPKLKSFIFVGDTNIVDGDISPCAGLEYAAFTNRKHYSHRFKRDPSSKIVVIEEK